MAWFTKNETPAKIPGTKALWTVCGSCKKYIPNAVWKQNGAVCPECGYHGRISSKERIALLADEGSFEELFADVGYSDHLHFRDASGAYVDKVEAAKKKTGEGESVTVGKAAMDGIGVVLGAMDFAFMGGSLGTGTGEKIARAAELALAEKRPFILASASGGARMQEGIRSLMQMAKTSAAIRRLKDAGIPYISILTDPTTGGVSASYAMLGDINIAEPKVLIGFAGRRVIENTIHQKLPPDFQTAEYLLQHGFVDKIVHRREMKQFIVKMLHYFGF